MLRGIYSAASGLIHTQMKQDACANNIANSTTTGYKQDKVVATPFEEVMIQNRDNVEFGINQVQQLGTMPFGVKSGEVYTDFTQGPLTKTEGDLDFAIDGRGFFTIRSFDGMRDTVKYTRDGSFRLDGDGRIVNSEGGYVLARDINTNEVGPMDSGGGSVTIDQRGRVFVDSVEKYALVISGFDDYEAIAKEGKNMYGAVDENTAPLELSKEEYHINQGQLEQPNIDIAGEMVNMVVNLRSFQANQKVIQSIDETLGKTVNEVGSLR